MLINKLLTAIYCITLIHCEQILHQQLKQYNKNIIVSVVVLEESPCPRGSLRTNFQVLVLVLVLGAQVLVLVLILELQVLVLVLVLGSSSPRKFLRTE